MSNPADPKKPAPDQPDPHTPADPNAPAGYGSSGSLFEFKLPDDVNSFGDLPPVPDPDQLGSRGDFGLLPPPPKATGPAGGASFDFGHSFADFDLGGQPAPAPGKPPGLISTEDSFLLPDAPAAPAPPSGRLDPPAVPPLEPPAALSVEPADLPGVSPLYPPAPEPADLDLPAPDVGALTDIDLGAEGADADLAFGEPLPDFEELPPDAYHPVSSGSVPDLGAVLPPPPAPAGSDSAVWLDRVVPGVDPSPSSFTLGSPEPATPAAPDSAPDIGSLRAAAAPPSTGSIPGLPRGPKAPSSTGSTPELPTRPAEPGYHSTPSFDFKLPDDVTSFSDLDPVPDPDQFGSKGDFDAVPPPPKATGPVGASFDFGNSFAELDFGDQPLPPPPAPAAGESKVGIGRPEPVQPASGWLDSSPPLTAAPAADDSDIFAGRGAKPADPAATSDVLSATSGAGPRLSDVALAFDAAPADEPDAGESIHGAPPAAADNPLFDSATLDHTAAPADEPAYGAAPAAGPDASSILADLSTPELHLDDASSVRVEAPGVGRTVLSGPSDGAFELTVPEEPLPAGLFDDDDRTAEPTAWHPASGSDPVDLEFPAGAAFGRTAADGPAPVPNQTDPTLEGPAVRPAAGRYTPPAAEEVDFDAVELADDQRTQAAPAGSLSAILRGELPDDSEERDRTAATRVAPSQNDLTREPEASVDFLSESNEEAPLPARRAGRAKPAADDRTRKARPAVADDEPPAPKPKTKTAKAAAARADAGERKGGKKGGVVAGGVVGALAAGAAFAGLYFGGVLPNEKAPSGPGPGTAGPAVTGPAVTGPGPAAAAAFDPRASFALGDGAKAVEHFNKNKPESPADKATAGQIRVFAKAHSLAAGATPAADDADLKAARDELNAVINADAAGDPEAVARAVRASVALGVSYELAGDVKAARRVYLESAARYPAYRATFEAHVARLDAQPAAAPAPGGTSRRPDPADAGRALLATLLLVQDGPKADDPEPGVFYWKAVAAAAAGRYKDALAQIDQAKEAHAKRARALAGRGVNPLSDPLEQIFTRSCDELKAYWKLRGAVSNDPDMLAELKKDNDKLAKALEAFGKSSGALAQAEKDLTAARTTAKTLEGEVTRLAGEVKAATTERAKAEAALKTAQADLTAAQGKVTAAEKKAADAAAELTDAKKEAKERQATVDALAVALKAVTPLPENPKPDDLLAAVKAVAARTTGPDLRRLVPDAMTAIGGGGLSAGQLLDIADRLKTAETAAKDALARLTTETAALKTAHAAELKKLDDGYTTKLEKLTKDHAEALKTAKDTGAAELKKMTDKYTADAKKLADDHAAALAKLEGGYKTALEEERKRTEAEKQRAAAREIEFQKQLANAVTPGQVMDIWLPVVRDLRRPADADLALAAAQKAIAGSSAGSEDAAKAQTVAGLAYLTRGEPARAKDLFDAARRSPAYKAAAGKPWAQAADMGLEAVADPSAPFRVPVAAPAVDVRAALVALDAGIGAYKKGSYDAAAKALLDATRNNPTDPVAWYFLGAARWQQGSEEQARKDFAQGAEREKAVTASNRTLSDAISPIQGPARDQLDRARP